MALTDTYIQVCGQLPEFLKKISEGEAPEHFSVQHLKDLGYSSSNHRPFIPLLKALGFLDTSGKPTQRYHDYRNTALSKSVLGEALRETYSDLFVLKAKPTDADKPLIQGKFKSVHNVSDHLAKLMTNTFYALLDLADINAKRSIIPVVEKEIQKTDTEKQDKDPLVSRKSSLHYNIQIHLPATKDLEVYNAIFKSLKEHLLD